MRIIPAIEIQSGQCVRLRQGDFNRVRVYPQTPQALVASYKQQGARHLHIVDLDGAKSGEIQQLSLIKAMQVDGVSFQVGGGIRSLESAQKCQLAGVEQLVLGSIAVSDPLLAGQIIHELGADRIVLAVDVRMQDGIPIPAIHGWQTTSQRTLWEVVSDYQDMGITHVLCTDIACDGMMGGPNMDLYEEALSRFPRIAWQASGGIRNQQDIERLSQAGLSGAIMGRALYEGDFDLAASLERELGAAHE